ncbi:MAG: hypothetical protein Q9223_000674 [Gallowayella weberi]
MEFTNPWGNSILSSTSTGIATLSSDTKSPAGTRVSVQPASTQISTPSQQEVSTSESLTTGKPSVAATAATNDLSNGNSSSGPASKIPIIIGVVTGVVAAAIAICLVWQNESTGFQDMVGRNQIRGLECMEIIPRTMSERSPGLLTGHGGDGYYSAALGPSEFTNDQRARFRKDSREVTEAGSKQFPYSPQSILFPTKEESVPSSPSLPNSGGSFASPTVRSELSAEPSPKPKLSPNPEKLEINKCPGGGGA